MINEKRIDQLDHTQPISLLHLVAARLDGDGSGPAQRYSFQEIKDLFNIGNSLFEVVNTNQEISQTGTRLLFIWNDITNVIQETNTPQPTFYVVIQAGGVDNYFRIPIFKP